MHDLHVIKKQTVCAVLTSFTVGLLPLFIYFLPLDKCSALHGAYLGFLTYSICLWFYCIIRDSESGSHTVRVQRGLVIGFLLFLVSEIMFFFSIFWAFFYFSLDPSPEIGCSWPPVGLKVWNVFGLPTFSTLILVVSGISVTLAHQAVLLGKRLESLVALAITVMLGLGFTCCQVFEYTHLGLKISDSVFGSIFYFSTGFHGIHVLIGTLFLFVQLMENVKFRLLQDQHVGLECSIWYWHFVDVVWLFLFVFIYFWGS